MMMRARRPVVLAAPRADLSTLALLATSPLVLSTERASDCRGDDARCAVTDAARDAASFRAPESPQGGGSGGGGTGGGSGSVAPGFRASRAHRSGSEESVGSAGRAPGRVSHKAPVTPAHLQNVGSGRGSEVEDAHDDSVVPTE